MSRSQATADKRAKTKARVKDATPVDSGLKRESMEFPSDPADLILFTKSLEGSMKPPAMHMELPLAPTYIREEPMGITVKPQLKGLCLNCVHNKTCIHAARAKGGVWHCEMYE
jgi:hypothetical protein